MKKPSSTRGAGAKDSPHSIRVVAGSDLEVARAAIAARTASQGAVAVAYDQSPEGFLDPFVNLYFKTVSELNALVERRSFESDDEFSSAMRFHQMLGVRGKDVQEALGYSAEHVSRWMNGQSRPHRGIRGHVVRECNRLLNERSLVHMKIQEEGQAGGTGRSPP